MATIETHGQKTTNVPIFFIWRLDLKILMGANPLLRPLQGVGHEISTFWAFLGRGRVPKKTTKKTMGFFLPPPLTVLLQVFKFLSVYLLYCTTFADSKEEGT
jgi:hypothetical protein